MLRGLLGARPSSSSSLNMVDESKNLELAMQAANYILDDDLDSADRGLQSGSSPFHKLGKGIIGFMRATLGFEADVMREASALLASAESAAHEAQRQAQHDPAAFRSSIYPPGSEYALCGAMSQIMGAIVAVTSESLTEGIRAFYKIRKAYMTLDALVAGEVRYAHSNPSSAPSTPRRGESSPRNHVSDDASTAKLANSHTSATTSTLAQTATSPRRNGHDDSDDEGEDDAFEDAEEEQPDSKSLPHYLGNLEIKDESGDSGDHSLDSEGARLNEPDLPPFKPRSPNGLERMLSQDPGSELFQHEIDVFVHSGTNLCYGLLLVLLGLVPPSFGRLLQIVGFRGDRERGLRMLWQASKFQNINGAFASTTLFDFYHGIMGSSDVVPRGTGVGDQFNVMDYPEQRLKTLLSKMRVRYPRSKLWKIHEARMLAEAQNLTAGLQMLSHDIESPLKQIHGLAVFERSLQAMYAHEYELCANSFLECKELNNWSPALYLFIAGAAHVELYRKARLQALIGTDASSDTNKAIAEQREQALRLFKEVRTHAGKKKLLARQLPFDVYVLHCLNKWDARVKTHGGDLVDAIGVAPFEILIYMWSGHKKMPPHALEQSLAALQYPASSAVASSETAAESTPASQSATVPVRDWTAESPDELAGRGVLRAACHRCLGQYDVAESTLTQEVWTQDASLLRGAQREDWVAPTAQYELAAILWASCTAQREHVPATPVTTNGEKAALAQHEASSPSQATADHLTPNKDIDGDRVKVRRAQEALQKAAGWERYMLDARVGMRVTTGLDTTKRWLEEHP